MRTAHHEAAPSSQCCNGRGVTGQCIRNHTPQIPRLHGVSETSPIQCVPLQKHPHHQIQSCRPRWLAIAVVADEMKYGAQATVCLQMCSHPTATDVERTMHQCVHLDSGVLRSRQKIFVHHSQRMDTVLVTTNRLNASECVQVPCLSLSILPGPNEMIPSQFCPSRQRRGWCRE